MEEFVVDNDTTSAVTLTYPAATMSNAEAALSVRTHYADPPVPVTNSNTKTTRGERLKSGDSRLSVEERYPAPADYIRAVRRAAMDLRNRRLLLEEDADRIIEDASKFPDVDPR